MAKKIHDEILKLNIVVNGNEAQKELGKLEESKRGLNQQSNELLKAKKRLIKAGKEESEAFKNLTLEIATNKSAVQSNLNKQKALREELGLTGLTMKQLRKEQRKLRTEMSNFTPGSDQYNELALELGRVENQMTDVRNSTRELQDTLNDGDAFSGFKEGVSGMFDGMKSGDTDAVKKGFSGIITSIKGMTKSALAFIATPLGATIAAVSLAIGGGKMWLDYNLEVAKSIRLTQQLTGTTGEELSKLRAEIQGVADTFDLEFNEVLKASSVFAKQMGISNKEALALVENGLVRGANANGDFLDKLKEYPIQFKNAGYSAQDFINIATQEAKGGIYDDKLLDTLKEMSLSLKEMDKAQIEVLQTNFGKKYADELAAGIDKGTISTKEAFESIIKKSREVGLTVKQQQKLVADVMKGAGEDAGGFEAVVTQLNIALDAENNKLTSIEEASLRNSEANKAYEKSLADLFDASQSGFPAMLENIKAIGKEIFTNLLVGINRLITSQEQLDKSASTRGKREAVKRVREGVKNYKNKDLYKEGELEQKETEYKIKAAKKNLEKLKKKLKGVNVFQDIAGKDSVYQEKLAEAKSYLEELEKIAKGTSDIYNAKKEEDKLNANIKTKKNTVTTTENKTKGKGESNNDREKALEKIKEAEEKKKELFEKANEEIDKLIQKQNQAKESALNQDIAKVKDKYAKEIALAKKHHLDEKAAKLEALQGDEVQAIIDEDIKLKLEKKQEELDALKQIEDENRIEKTEQQFERDIEKAETDEEKALLLLEKVKSVAEQQIDIEQEAELAKVENMENAEAMKAAIIQKYDLKKAKIKAEYDKGKLLSEKEEQKRDKEMQDQKLAQYGTMFGNMASILGKHTIAGKAAAVAQTTIDTYLGAQKAYTSQLIPGDPTSIIRAVIAGGSAVAAGIANIQKITSTDTSVPGYEDGLYKTVTRNDGKKFKAKIGKTTTGLVTQPTLMDGKYLAGERSSARNPEMIIDDVTYSKLDPRIPEEIMAVKNGTYKGYENGMYNESKINTDSVSENKEDSATINLLRRIAAATENGTNVSLSFGYDDVERIQQMQGELDGSKKNSEIGQ